MATKKQNLRHQVRRARKALNAAEDIPTAISGKRIARNHWGRGIGRRDFAPAPGQLAEDDDTWDDMDPRS